MTLIPIEVVSKFVGFNLAEASSIASVHGWSIRVAKRDGVDQELTADANFQRVNVETENGIITKVCEIG